MEISGMSNQKIEQGIIHLIELIIEILGFHFPPKPFHLLWKSFNMFNYDISYISHLKLYQAHFLTH